MAKVTLRSTHGLVTLPNLKWIGSVPAWPVTANKQMEEATMLDGSRSFAFFGVKRDWGIVLGFLTKAQLDVMTTLNSYDEVLQFVNYNEDDIEYDVVISSFSYQPERMDIRQLERYRVEMTLRES